jgi:hypothetical protein
MTVLNRKDIILALSILGLAFFLRIYRLDQLLGFYFDQGRDALVIRDLLLNHKLFLIGPTTGIDGIFLGPLYYLTLIPWYALGDGNPVFPAIYSAMTTILALAFTARVGYEISGKRTAFIFLLMGGFSHWMIVFSRWLANPTQLMLASSLAIFGLWRVLNGKPKYWFLVSIAVAAGLQFEAAGAIYFLPAIIIFLLFNRRLMPKGKVLILSGFIFFFFLLPQIIFDFRHEHIMTRAFFNFLFVEKSFHADSLLVNIPNRIYLFVGFLGSKIFPSTTVFSPFVVIILLISAIICVRKLINRGTQFLLIWLITPLLGLTFYQGNHGYIWDYYLMGVYLTFLLLVSVLISKLSMNNFGKILALVILSLFFWVNLPMTWNHLSASIDNPTNIYLSNEKQAVSWVFQNAGQYTDPFNVDVYVPPVIPYSYDYLFAWLGTTMYHKNPESSVQVPRVYTLYEVDPPHPERLSSWLSRQNGIGAVEKIATFGGITVERRHRYKLLTDD